MSKKATITHLFLSVLIFISAALFMPGCFDFTKDTEEEDKIKSALIEAWIEEWSEVQNSSVNLYDISRERHTTLIFKDKIWIIGGMKCENYGAYYYYYKDVLWTTDMVHWYKATKKADWGRRCGHASVVFNGKMWIFGGEYLDYWGGHFLRDIWNSEDGINWKYVGLAQWDKRAYHSVVVHNNKIYIIGGAQLCGAFFRDVWSSDDGISWIKLTDDAFPNEFYPNIKNIASATAISYNNKIWIIGGECAGTYTYYRNSIWYSEDGISWTNAKTTNPDEIWAHRRGLKAAVFNNKIWISGGEGTSGIKGDVWYLDNSAGDFQAPWVNTVTHDSKFNPRTFHSFLVYKGYLWIFQGYGNRTGWCGPDEYGEYSYYSVAEYITDAWRTTDGYNWELVTEPTQPSWNY